MDRRRKVPAANKWETEPVVELNINLGFRASINLEAKRRCVYIYVNTWNSEEFSLGDRLNTISFTLAFGKPGIQKIN